MGDIKNEKLEEGVFHRIREEILNHWPTGKDIDFQEAVEYQKALSKEKNFAAKLDQAKAEGCTLIQPRAGVALPEEHIRLLNYLEEEGGADLLPSTIDSYTRLNRYKEAQRGIEESRKSGRSMLNGFPAVNHGVSICRRVTESLKSPVQVRHGTPDARLLTEITMAGGFTSYEGGGISYNIPYSKNHSLVQTITDWQYCDRVIGLYEEAGVTINREPFGPLTGTLVPPGISNAIAVIEALLAATQGCKHFTVGYGQCGNLIQDVAAIRSLAESCRAYLDKFGFQDAAVTTVLHQWMGGFPADESQAFGVISAGALVAALSGATKVIVKTPHEAMGVPTMEANAAGLKTTKQMVSMFQDQSLLDTKAVSDEVEVLQREIDCIIDKVLELGRGDLAQGAVNAFEAGVLDIPFAPSRYNAGKVLPARDNSGAIRYLEFGNLPFGEDLKALHRDKLAERGRYEDRQVNFQMVIDDIYAISKGHLVGRPSKE